MKILFALTLLFVFSFQVYSQATGTINKSVTLKDIEKESLKSKKDIWVLDFWASWCGPCMQSLPHLTEVYGKYKDQHVKLISLSLDRTQEAWERTVIKKNMDWPQIFVSPTDDQNFINQNFPHPFIPCIFVIDRKGTVTKVDNVYQVEKYIEDALKK